MVEKSTINTFMHPVEKYQSEMWRNFDAPPKRKKKKNAKTILHGTGTLLKLTPNDKYIIKGNPHEKTIKRTHRSKNQ